MRNLIIFLFLLPLASKAFPAEYVFTVNCKESRENDFSGIYVYEYLMTQANRHTPVSNYQRSLGRIGNILAQMNEELGKDFQQFRSLVLNEDFSQRYVWEKAPFGIAKTNIDFLNVANIPQNCRRENEDKNLTPLIMIRSAVESELPLENQVINYDFRLWSELSERSPIQISFAITSSWLKSYMSKQSLLNRVTSYLHSERILNETPKDIDRQLSAMGFGRRERDEKYGQLALAQEHSCAIFKSKIYCWGGQSRRFIPVPDHIINPTQLVTGSEYACALFGGKVDCWGQTQYPMKVPKFSSDVVKIFKSKRREVCAMSHSEFKCWGIYAANISFPPKEIFSARRVILGETFGCLLHAESDVKCWGSRNVPRIPKYRVPLKDISWGVANQVCVFLESGEVKCHGHVNRSNPVRQLNFSGASKIDHGGLISCGLFPNDLQCWNLCYDRSGGPSYYQRASLPDFDHSLIKDFKVGSKHACVLLTTGVKCWSTTCYGGDIYHNETVPAPILIP